MIRALLLVLLGFIQPAQAYDLTFHRYLSDNDLFRVMKKSFPGYSQSMGVVEDSCRTMDTQTRGLLGASSPATGAAVFSAPSPAFLLWFTKCSRQYVAADFGVALNSLSELRRYIPPEADAALGLAGLGNGSGAAALNALKAIPWKSVGPAARKSVALQLIRTLIGPGVAANEGGIADALLMALNDQPELVAEAAIRKIAELILIRDEFLSY
jgi:hypothetical protein